MTEPKDYKDTVFLPKTDFPMKAGLAQKEPAIAAKWEADGLYAKLRAARKGRERFVLHDGPPYANGDIHMGHALNKVLKDIIVRSQTLLGKDAPYTPGWDCHGLPIEWKIEEEYRKKKLNKDEVPAKEFRAQCRAYADTWVGVQKEQFKRLGVMGDWDNPYLTMKFEAEAAIVGELLKFAESSQLYRGAKPVMWSPVEKTALAEAEVEYEDVTSTQIDVAFEIVDAPNCRELEGAYAVIWTTTPWTIPTNQGIAYGEGIEYWCVKINGMGPYLVAGDLVEALAARIAPGVSHFLDVSWRGTGTALAGATARHPIANLLQTPLPFRGGAGGGGTLQAPRPEDTPHSNPSPEGEGLKTIHPASPLAEFFLRPRPFLPAPHVTTDAGTGLVHMAPDHGEEDFFACKAVGIDPVFAVTDSGFYREDWAWLGGQGSVINTKFNAADGPICSDLREAGALLSASEFRHSYPHSWRSKARIIYRCTPQWFIPMDRERDANIPLCETEAGIHAAQGSNTTTLRQTALAAIEDTRWVPTRSRNRIFAMVSDRPDWVISRQRAWGVPIALYVHKQTGDYLRDAQVNARIRAAFEQGGADAWFGADHQALLGNEYSLDDYEVVNDILDVWFDSGSTHSFVVEPQFGTDADDRADLYLEGSDQHRGWFQSSLLESCGTRGRAPYKSVLTHGFALDGQGRKMSKSLGNVVDPLKIMSESGADILRMWVASTDYFDDVRIGKEVLAGSSDAYRKLRNTFRYLLGALEGFDEDGKVPVSEMPELERYMLHRLAELDATLREVVENRASESWLEFSRYTRALNDFANIDLSAFFFDIRKDCLYCDVNPETGKQTDKRRAYRTVLNVLFHALVRYAAPIIPFTAEEVWKSRFPDADSVHMLDWPDFASLLSRHSRAGGDPASTTDLDSRLRGNDGLLDEGLAQKWGRLRHYRDQVNEAIEPHRREKTIRSSLEANAIITAGNCDYNILSSVGDDLPELWITSGAEVILDDLKDNLDLQSEAVVTKTTHHKCGRCWRHLPEVTEDGDLCNRCEDILS
ncbi:isoleucine--tRNA ligase [Sphingobium sp. DEHP117]|uniref:isoleucine--tRNA ligase n=1 Tax=Sphingobium sp. DEHP117 TaxID=2993436 RepID=UPI0027D538E5|nr:isoleucine--tRNA ligase [Sphingobium sp. DEHP117]MDQ4419219.1 isoleucine--tRNA ligase [Sphingobium sp. DEHP117]